MRSRAMSAAEAPRGWISFIEERLRAAVSAVASSDGNPDDPLRGLYISDEQALSLAVRHPIIRGWLERDLHSGPGTVVGRSLHLRPGLDPDEPGMPGG